MITFGSYVFPVGFRLDSQVLDSKIDDVVLLGIAGSQAPPGMADIQTINLVGSVGGGEIGTAGVPLLSMPLVKAELVTMMGALNSGYQLLDLGDTPQRAILCQKKSVTVTREEGYGQRYATVKLAFEAVDPRFLSGVVHTVPFTNESQGDTATNAGDAVSFPVFTIAGPAMNPQIFCAPLPPGYNPTVDGVPPGIRVEPTVTLGAGDLLTINCDPRQRPQCIVLNGVARLDLLGPAGILNTIGNSALFPYLLSGINAVSLFTAAAGNPGLVTCNISWQDAWSI